MPYFSDSSAVSSYAHIKAISALTSRSFDETLASMPPHLQHTKVHAAVEKGDIDRILGNGLLPAPSAIEFLKSRRIGSYFASAFDAFFKAPFGTRIVANSTAVTGTVLEPGEAIPVSDFTLGGSELEVRNAYAICVASNEFLRFGDASAVNALHVLLSEATTDAIDLVMLAEIAAASGTQSFASSGITAENFRNDFTAMLDHVNRRGVSGLHWIASRTAANRLLFDGLNPLGPLGGSLLEIPLIVSDGVPENSSGGSLMLVDSGRIAANVQGIRIDVSADATLQMADTPSASPSNTTSMFQTNSSAIRADLVFGFELLNGFRAALLEGIA